MKEDLTRRALFSATGAVCAGAVLAGCGSYGDGGQTPPSGAKDTPGTGSGNPGAAGEIAKKADVPVGGGIVNQEQKVVVVQPEKGDYKAYTAVCPHQKNLVDKVEGGTINCPWHGSKFKVEDGSVANGPATKGLEEKKIDSSGESIVLKG